MMVRDAVAAASGTMDADLVAATMMKALLLGLAASGDHKAEDGQRSDYCSVHWILLFVKL